MGNRQNVCNICGANYEYRNGRWICPACGAYKSEELSNEEVTLLYNAAQKLRLCDFDEAERLYNDIIQKYPKNPSGYWGRLLSKYGIKYEEDINGRKIPTCYAARMESVIADRDYLKATELANKDTKTYYELQAQYMERVRREWIEKARKQKPYDVFLCYKDSDITNGIERTKDSFAVQELYIHLKEKGYRVFYSRESLRDKVGEKYEPYIFNALSTAKVMIVYGSQPDYITSTWLKNEWTRYKKRMDAGEKKAGSLLVACEGFAPSELPTVLSSMQCLDASKKNFYGDLDAAVARLVSNKPEKTDEQIKADNKRKKIIGITSAAVAMVALIICLSIFIPKLTHTDLLTNSEYGVSIKLDEPLEKGTVIDIATIESGDKYALVQSKLPVECSSFKLYDLNLEKGGKAVDFNGNVTVSLPVPSGMDKNKLAVYYIADDGTVEEMASAVVGNTVSFTTTHFSMYAIAEKTVSEYSITRNTDGTLSISSYNGDKTVIIIPSEINGNMVTAISAQAFHSFDKLTSVTIPEGVISIGANAFYGCTSIVTLTIPSTVVTIGTSAFFGWSRSQEIVVKGRTSKPESWNAQWNASCDAVITYGRKTVCFNANSGIGTMDNQLADMGVETHLSANRFNKAGYSFVGWSTDKNGAVIYADDGLFTAGSETTYTLYALWTPNENAVTFDANGGTGTMPQQTIRTDETANLNASAFIKDGYTFSGWSTSTSGTVIYTDEAPYTMGTESIYTLYAIWAANHNTVIFNSNGGVGSMDVMIIDTNVSKALTRNIFTKAGYKFEGWSLTKNGTAVYQDGAVFKMDSTASATLYAVWSANSNSLHLFANNGTTEKVVLNIATGEQKALPKNTFIRAGYTFEGWSTTQNGTVTYADEASYTMGIDTVYNLYVVWTANENTLHFNAGSGTGTMTDTKARTDSKITLPECTFTKYGYTFAGWATSSGGTIAFADKASYTMSVQSEYTLYAIWTKGTYSITYEMDGGTNNVANPVVYDVDTETIALSDPDKYGYTFVGWYTTSIYGTKVTAIFKGSTGNKTLFAKWQANTNTISFDANGGTGTQESVTGTTDSTINLPSVTFTRKGYSFVGWATTPSGSVAYKDKANYTVGVNSAYTLYAIWNVIDYTISYDLAGGSFDNTVSQSYNVNSNTITLSTPKRVGYTFLGWTGTDLATASKTVTIASGSVGNRFYTATWKATTNSMVFNGNGNTGGSMSTQNIDTDATAILTACGFTKTGYHFIGWADSASGTVQYVDKESYKMGANSTYTLYAKWEANTNTPYVVYHYQQNANDDGYTLVSTQNLTGTSDSSVTPAVNTYTGFDSPAKQTKTIAADGSMTVSYYYTRKTNTLSFVTNGGTEVNDKAVKYQQTLELSSLTTREGYTFGGWFTDKNLTNSFTATNTLSENTTVYAWWQEENKPSNFTYSGTTTLTINSYVGTSTTMWIPEYIGGVAVTTIPGSAFNGCANITEVYVPKSVTSIGEGAFQGLNMLNKITLPFVGGNRYYSASVGNSEYSSTYLFGYIFGAHSAHASNYAPAIDGYTYQGQDYYQWKNVSNSTYYNDYRYYCIPETLIEVVITDATGLSANAFYNCSMIQELTLNDGIKGIYSGAFQNCTNLLKLNSDEDGKFILPTGITAINEYVLYNCNELVSINSTTAITSIENYSFYGCEKLTMIHLGRSITSIGDYAFQSDTSLENIDLGDEIQSIGHYAFYGCTALMEVKVGSKLQTIGNSAFNGCTNLKRFDSSEDNKIILPEATTSIDSYAFNGCANITEVYVPKSVTSVGEGAFQGLNMLNKITLPFVGGSRSYSSTVSDSEYSSAYLFGYIFGSYTVNENITHVEGYVYQGQPRYTWKNYSNSTYYHNYQYYKIPITLTEIEITDATGLSANAFYNCSMIQELTLNDGIKGIYSGAFQNCTNLLKLNSDEDGEFNLPNGITYIGDGAFNAVVNMSAISLDATVKSIGSNAFNNCGGLRNVVYGGLKEDNWNQIEIGSGNDYLLNATKTYFKGTMQISLNLGSVAWEANGYCFAVVFDNGIDTAWEKLNKVDGKYVCDIPDGYETGTFKFVRIKGDELTEVNVTHQTGSFNTIMNTSYQMTSWTTASKV